MIDKYKMTQTENTLLAKRNIIDSMWKSANLEGIAITFPETQAIYDGINISKFRIDEIQTINNLKHAWNFILSTINDELTFNYISSINSLIGSNLIESPGQLRIYEINMGGTTWKPELPSLDKINKIMNDSQKYNCQTEQILFFMCNLMKLQPFNDGNKRTAMLVANHELIKNGHGILSISNENKVDFGTKLIAFYEDSKNLPDLISFLCNNCLDGLKAY